MAYILGEDLSEKMNWLASAPDSLLLSYIAHVKALIHLHSISTPINNGGAGVTFNCPNPHLHGWPVNSAADGFLNYQQQHREEFLPAFMGDSHMMSANGRSDSVVFARGEAAASRHHQLLRRSLPLIIEEGGGGNGNGNGNGSGSGSGNGSGNGFVRKPCIYHAKGFCKNGSNCKFLHEDNVGGEAAADGGGGGMSGFDESMKLKAFHNQQQQRGDSSSRQIYLTFPADSTFTEEDVCDYFRMFGPVQDVRIPCQEKRMFGFVIFDTAESVNVVLAKGNPHFVCDSKVLVKPYKEKTKVQEKKYHQLPDRGEYSSSSNDLGIGIDSREHFDLPFGPRMILNRQNMIQEYELQHIRMMSLQLSDQHARNHFLQGFPSSIPGFSSSIPYSQFLLNQRVADLCDSITEYDSQGFSGGLGTTIERVAFSNLDSEESMTQFLPHNLLASPTKSAADNRSTLSK